MPDRSASLEALDDDSTLDEMRRPSTTRHDLEEDSTLDLEALDDDDAQEWQEPQEPQDGYFEAAASNDAWQPLRDMRSVWEAIGFLKAKVAELQLARDEDRRRISFLERQVSRQSWELALRPPVAICKPLPPAPPDAVASPKQPTIWKRAPSMDPPHIMANAKGVTPITKSPPLQLPPSSS